MNTKQATTNISDVYSRVTNQIIEAIEAGAGTFNMPWHRLTANPTNAVSNKPYRGVNLISLWAVANSKGYSSNLWATYQQWKDLGAQVRKGEKSAVVVFWKFFDQQQETDQPNDADEKSSRRPPLARAYFLFNANQVDGFQSPTLPELSETERIDRADAFFQATGVDVRHDGNAAFYSLSGDYIQLPAFKHFKSASDYYATLGHECIHMTAHPSRCNRELKARYGSESYAMEELIAELGAAFLCTHLQIDNISRQDHAAYIQSWLKVLKNDKKAIFNAASKAQHATDWLINLVNNNQLKKAG